MANGGIQELAERLLVPLPFGDDPAPGVELLPGCVPDGLPLDLPLPAGARVVGSKTHRVAGALASAEVVLDARGASEDVLAFYARELPGRGWHPASPGADTWGGFWERGGVYCRGPAGPWLRISVVARGARPLDVRIRVELRHPGPCGDPPTELMASIPVLPRLEAPPGMRLLGGHGSGRGPHMRWSDSEAETELPAAELAAHFAGQFEALGWTRTNEGTSGALAWSMWRAVRDGTDWQGLLLVLEGPAPRQRAFSARVWSTPPY